MVPKADLQESREGPCGAFLSSGTIYFALIHLLGISRLFHYPLFAEEWRFCA